MSAATEKQNNGDVATVEKVSANAKATATATIDAVKDDLKVKSASVEDKKQTTTPPTGPVVSSDNGTASKEEKDKDKDATDAVPAKETLKTATKRPADGKGTESKKVKKDNNRLSTDDDEILDDDDVEDDNVSVSDSDVYSEEYDIRYDGEEDEIECDDDDDDNDDGSGSDDQELCYNA